MVTNIIKRWIPFAFLATTLCGLVYLAVQQSLRQGANDPQVQMAEDAARAINAGASSTTIIPSDKVTIGTSLAPYLIYYSATNNYLSNLNTATPISGIPIAGNGVLQNGLLPNLPAGVFDYAKANGENRITWQPAPGIRQAIVIVPTNGGYVVAGRSLREVEIREDQAEKEAGAAWIVTLAGLFIIELGIALLESRQMKKNK